ncbi:MAG TPA: hypothetical protein PKD66_07665 [Azonexus sp.]|jgi:hypothetical protein|nr:hypothetical protein [Azonexus sp.]
MNETTEPSCNRCHYFRAVDATSGLCHRYPPVFSGDSSPRESHHWRHPSVGSHGWCGEFWIKPVDQTSSSGVTI